MILFSAFVKTILLERKMFYPLQITYRLNELICIERQLNTKLISKFCFAQ